MRFARLRALGLAMAAALLPSVALSQALPLNVDVGFRFLDVTGNRDMYRSQVNDREGFLVRSLNLSLTELGSVGDHLDLDVRELGAGPWGSARLQMGKSQAYKLTVTSRNTQHFSALPYYANPLSDSGVIPGQHTVDRTRNSFDLDLELLPGKMVTPFVGYSYDRYSGPGTTTYHVGQDEFQLSNDLKETNQEFRVGAAFDAGPVYGQISQGWRFFRGTEALTLAPGGGTGNLGGSIEGMNPSLTTFTRSGSTDVDTPVTNAYVAGKLWSRVKLVGEYARAKASSDDSEKEDLTGNLVSYELDRFFKGLDGTSTSKADATFWRAGGRLELNIVKGLDLVGSYVKRHRQLDGMALISDLYSSTLNLSGFDPKDIQTLIDAQTSLERTEETWDVSALARGLGPFDLRAGYSQTDQSITVNEDPSEIIVPWGQEGTWDRQIKTFHAGASFHLNNLTLTADWTRQRADQAVMRTDFHDRDQIRVRATWAPKDWVRMGGTAQGSELKNDTTGINLNGRYREYGGFIEVSPVKVLWVRLNGSQFEADSTVHYRLPYAFREADSVQSELGKGLEAAFTLDLKPFVLDAGFGRFRNDGSYPFTLDRSHATVELMLTDHVGVIGEWQNNKYTERFTTQANLGDFEANRYGLYLRWKP